MSVSEERTNDGRDASEWRKLAAALSVSFVVWIPVATYLTDLSPIEAVAVFVPLLLGAGLVRLYVGLPLGADLRSSPLLAVVLAIGALAAAITGYVFALRYGRGIVPHETAGVAAARAYLLGLLRHGLGVGSVPTYRQLRSAAGPDAIDAQPGRVALGSVVEPVELAASVEPPDGPFEAPFSGSRAVCASLRVTEPSRSSRGDDLLLDELQCVPYVLRGSGSSVRIDTSDADLRLDVDLRATERGEAVPDVVADYLAANDVAPRPSDRARTFTERRLEPGDPATVVGDASHRDGRLVVTDLVIEDGPLDATIAAYRTAIVRGVGGGSLIAAIGLVGLLVTF